MRLSRVVRCIVVHRSPIVRGGVEPGTAVLGGPATYQIAVLLLHHRTVGRVGVEPTFSCSQNTRGAVPLHPELFLQRLVWESNPSHGIESAVSSNR
jgi:hypothetical protein